MEASAQCCLVSQVITVAFDCPPPIYPISTFPVFDLEDSSTCARPIEFAPNGPPSGHGFLGGACQSGVVAGRFREPTMVQSRSFIPKTEFALLIGLGRQGSCLLHSRHIEIVQIVVISARHTSGEIEEMKHFSRAIFFHSSLTQHHVLPFHYCHLLDSSFVHSFATGIRNSTYSDPEFSPRGSETGDQQTVREISKINKINKNLHRYLTSQDIAGHHSRPPLLTFYAQLVFSAKIVTAVAGHWRGS